MAGSKNNDYLGYAEDDYQFFKSAYQLGLRGNAIASSGHHVCGKYLEHIVDVCSTPESETELLKKQDVMRTHNLRKLLAYLKDDMGLLVTDDVQNALVRINGFYFETRYPGDASFYATEDDMEAAMCAVDLVRSYVLRVLRELGT